MKVTETKDTMVCEATEPSEKAMAVSNAITDVCREQNVSPAEIFPIFGEAITRLLVITAQVLGYDEESYVHSFGEGLATCVIKQKKKGN